MASQLELHDARLSSLQWKNEMIEVHFSYAHIHKTKGSPGRDTGKGWSQEAVLRLEQAKPYTILPPLPGTIIDGYLESDGNRYELLPLPFERNGPAHLHLDLSDGSSLDILGNDPQIRLEGEKVFLEDYI